MNFHIPLNDLDSEIEIKTYDLQGRIVVDNIYTGQEVIQLNTTNFSSSFYVYVIRVDGVLLKAGKLIKI